MGPNEARHVAKDRKTKAPAAPPKAPEPDHDCFDHAVPYESDGALGHGWECGRCGAFLQAG